MTVIANDSINTRLKHAWNAFRGRDSTEEYYSYRDYGVSSSARPDRTRFSRGNDKSIISSIYCRIANDVAANSIHHVRVDDANKYLANIEGPLENALNVSANLDQTGRAMLYDAVASLFDEGCIAIVPVETTINPNLSGGYEINTLRVGKIVEWYPAHVKVQLYNEETGKTQQIVLAKSFIAIVENPFYAIMNDINATLRRLIRKLNLMDVVDKQIGSGKLDLIIQLPYVLKTDAKLKQAEERRKQLENQLRGSTLGIGYIDATEHVTQLNRAVENNIMSDVQYLTSTLYNQLGLTETIFNGTADEATMLNYHNRTIAPVLDAISEEMKRKFLTKTALTQKQSIIWLSDPFKLVPTEKLADIADKFTRNEILSSNEVRAIVGFRPVEDPRANELRNKNLNASNDQLPGGIPEEGEEGYEDEYEYE